MADLRARACRHDSQFVGWQKESRSSHVALGSARALARVRGRTSVLSTSLPGHDSQSRLNRVPGPCGYAHPSERPHHRLLGSSARPGPAALARWLLERTPGDAGGMECLGCVTGGVVGGAIQHGRSWWC